MKITFRYDGRTYRGPSADDIVISLMLESHDRTSDPSTYMGRVAGRVHVMYGPDYHVRTDSTIHFLKDLVTVGAARSITKVLSEEE